MNNFVFKYEKQRIHYNNCRQKIGATVRRMVALTDENRKIIVSKLNKN